ncbi:MAG: purine-nucleoside phosphorylase [Thermoguttaceae bacterium]|nr:purine-nucleoside phosphorylase [Thermoguttaceae bacterium]MBQ6619648.1 purine-nucleoside phosphorylase [Thermoguttaceae bacterium]
MPSDGYYEKIREAADFIRARWDKTPEAAIILGTGLGHLAERIETDRAIPYSEIPNFPVSTVESHAGLLILGRLEGKTVAALQGRFHCYEGYTARQVAFPVYVMKLLGAKTLIVSNACGGLNPQFSRGDIMLIEDHINLLGTNPLIGPNDDRLGPRYPDMYEPYSRQLRLLAESVALQLGIRVCRGVYAALPGPNLETRAEYRFLRFCGADTVGMSTVPEVIAAVHAGLKVLGFSIITDMGLPDALTPVDIGAIVATAVEAEPKMNQIICGVLRQMN